MANTTLTCLLNTPSALPLLTDKMLVFARMPATFALVLLLVLGCSVAEKDADVAALTGVAEDEQFWGRQIQEVSSLQVAQGGYTLVVGGALEEEEEDTNDPDRAARNRKSKAKSGSKSKSKSKSSSSKGKGKGGSSSKGKGKGGRALSDQNKKNAPALRRRAMEAMK